MNIPPETYDPMQHSPLRVNRADRGLNWTRSSRVPDVADPELYRACQGFEAYFARYLIREMRGEQSMMGSMPGAENYQGMYDEMLGEQIASSGGLGIAQMLYRQVMEDRGISPRVQSDQTDLTATTDARLEPFNDLIEAAAERHNVEPDLIRALIMHESGGNTNQVNQRGGRGLMALTENMTLEENVRNPFNPSENIDAGAHYLSRQIEQFGEIPLALAAWHAGPAAVQRFNGTPPFRETDMFVNEVLDFFEVYHNAEESDSDY